MHPDHKVDRILIPGETKTGEGLAGPSGPAEAPTAGGGDSVPSDARSPQHAGSATSAPATPIEKPDGAFPRMPTQRRPRLMHRKKIAAPQQQPHFSAAVARPVRKDEFRSNPKAKAFVDVEWAKLRAVGDRGCWHESSAI